MGQRQGRGLYIEKTKQIEHRRREYLERSHDEDKGSQERPESPVVVGKRLCGRERRTNRRYLLGSGLSQCEQVVVQRFRLARGTEWSLRKEAEEQ